MSEDTSTPNYFFSSVFNQKNPSLLYIGIYMLYFEMEKLQYLVPKH